MSLGQVNVMHLPGGSCFRILMLCLLIAGLVAVPIDAQTPKKDAPALRLPSGAIIIVAKDAESLDRPEAVYLTPEKYREMSEQIEAFRKLLAAERTTPPNSCELEARIESRGAQSLMRVKAVCKFRAATPRSVIFLGFQKAQLVEAKLDSGKLPLLSIGDKGLSLAVDAAGDQVITLQFDLPLTTRGGETGFELGLPGSPITTLIFDAPDKVNRVQLGRRDAAADAAVDTRRMDADRLSRGRGGEALGAVTFLALAWDVPGTPAATAVAKSAEAEVHIQVNEGDISTDARLKLRGTAADWRFTAPFNAEVAVGRPPATAGGKLQPFPVDQAPELVRPEPGKSEWRVRFKENNSSELQVSINHRVPRPKAADPKAKTNWPVGPYAVIDVPRQEGTIRVRTVPQVRVTGIPRGDTQRIDTGDDPNGDLLFRYQSLPIGKSDQVLAPLELELRAAVGTVQTRIRHLLQFVEGGWRIKSEITAVPIRSEVESLELEVPSPGVFEASTPKLVEGIVPLREISSTRRVVQIKLASPQRSEFTLTLEGQYPVALAVQEATLALPRLLNVFDRSGEVSVITPEGFDLKATAFQWETDKPGTRPFPLEPEAQKRDVLTTTVSRSPAAVELNWKPQRPDLRVTTATDVTLGDRQAIVMQQIRITSGDRPFRRVRLRGTPGGPEPVVTTGSLEPAGPGEYNAALPTDTRDTMLTLQWALPLPADESIAFNIPLLWPEPATVGENRVRFLRDRDAVQHWLPTLDATDWRELPIELLPAETTLLVARSFGASTPLAVRLRDTERGTAASPQIIVERALVQAQTDEAGQRYRTRFFIPRWNARQFECDLPDNAADIDARINGLAVDVRDATAEGGRAIAIPLPATRDRQPLLIDLRYRLPPNAGEGLSAMTARLQPPRPRGRAAVTTTRWQIAFPNRLVALTGMSATTEDRWSFRNGLVQPQPAYGANDLERWITRGQEPTVGDTWEMPHAGLTMRTGDLQPVRLLLIPRTLWIITISLIVIAAGLILSRLNVRQAGILLSLAVAGMVVAATAYPQPFGQLFVAMQPGLAILLAVLMLYRMVQWQYRRRLARMPGFTRVHAESALVRSNTKRPVRETSTVDSPAAG